MNNWFRFVTDSTQLTKNRIGVASCYGCHKSGEGHYGNKTVTVKNSAGVDVENSHATNASQACLDCHTDSAHRHATYFTETQGKAFKAGLHGNSSNNHYVDESGDINSTAYCGYCHSYNYSWKYNPLDGSRNVAEIRAAIGDKPLKNMANTPLSCATCHEPHGGGLSKKVVEQSDGSGKLIYSKEFVLCTSCHIVKLEAVPVEVKISATASSEDVRSLYYLDDSVYGAAKGSSAQAAEAAVGQHFFARGDGVRGLSYMGNFVKNHFATAPGKTMVTEIDAQTVVKAEATTGLNIDAAARRACSNCHDPHKAARFAPATLKSGKTLTQGELTNIQKTFAKSGHAAYTKHQWNYANFYSNAGVTASGRGCMPCHNGGEAVKFMEAVQDAWDYATGPLRSIQRIKTNGMGGASMGCVNCHDPDDAVEGPTVGGDGKRSLALSGKLRASNGNHAATHDTPSDGNFYLPAEQTFVATTSKLPSAVLAKQKGDNTLVCFTCHSGRSNVYVKNTDFADNKYRTYIHNDPAAGNVAGILLPKIKDAVYIDGLKPRSDNTSWSTHGGTETSVSNFSGVNFPKCTQCHNINKDGHSLAAYRDKDGNPLIQDITDSSLINIDKAASVYATSAGKGCYCHGDAGDATIAFSKKTAKGFAEAMDFYEDALKIAGVNLKWTGRGFQYWDTDPKWDTWDNETWATTDKGLKKFAVALTFDALIHDWGAYAHLGVPNLRQTLGEALAFIYQSKINGLGDAAGFKAWLETTAGESFTDGSGNLSKLGDAGLEFLCPNAACAYDSWKSDPW
jgi:hypothetical protein